MSQLMSRRAFLKRSCLTAAGIGLAACGGLTAVGTYQPPVDLPTTLYGDSTMKNRFLIAYASKAGSTAEVATRMGERLSKQNLAIDVKPISQVTDISAYQTVILGSAIRMSKILPEAMTFIEKNQALLKQKSFHLFILCMTLVHNDPESRKKVNDYLEPVRAVIKPTSEGLFAGVVNGGKLDLFSRVVLKMIGTPEGDFRQWDQINTWSQQAAVLVN